jgi:tripartite-type tricarboxylate transporter receptor subunit TctC
VTVKSIIGDKAMRVVTTIFAFGIFLFILFLVNPLVLAQKFPERPIRYVVTDQPGSSIDVLARIITEKLSIELGQPVIVENRAGAGGNIGADIGSKANGDGYTIVQLATTHLANIFLYKNLPYNLQKDFVPVIQLASSPSVLVVPNTLPIKNVSDFFKFVKSKSETLQYASAGTGTCTFLAAELFKKQSGVDMMHIPYKGGAPAMTSVLAGETSAYFSPLGPALQHIRQGSLRAIAVSSSKRLTLLPDVPTLSESGLLNYQFSCWYGLFLPISTPKSIQDIVYNAVLNTINQSEVKKKLFDQGFIPIGNKQDDFVNIIRSEIDIFKDLVKEIPSQ